MTSALVLTYIQKHPEEAAALIEGNAIPDVVTLFESLTNDLRAALIPYLSMQYLHEMTHLLDEDMLLELSKRQSVRTLFNVFSVLPHERQMKYLPRLPRRAQWYLKYAHKHHDKYIATLLSIEYLSLVETMTAEQAWKMVKKAPHKVSMIYTHDDASKELCGQITLEELYAASRTTILRDVAQVVRYSQTPFTPISNITQHNIWRHFDTIPIVDHQSRLLGVIPTKAIYEEILKEDHDSAIALYDNMESLISGFYSVVKTLYDSGEKEDS